MPLIIKMPQSIENETIGKSFNSLFLDIILKLDETNEDDIILDFTETKILNPFFVLPLFVYISKSNKKFKSETNELIDIYFNKIGFFDLCDVEALGEEHLEDYISLIYTPITRFPGHENEASIRDRIVSSVERIIIKQLHITGNLFNALKYLLSELIDNIAEHSESDYGYIFAQYNEENKYVDICIVDEGITLLGSYNKANTNIETVESDVDALKKATIGVSTKNRPNVENRGYGITTSRKMLVDGLKGQFFMFSGNAFYRYYNDGHESKEEYVGLPTNISWDGTIVLLRIPYNENDDFNYTDYLE